MKYLVLGISPCWQRFSDLAMVAIFAKNVDMENWTDTFAKPVLVDNRDAVAH